MFKRLILLGLITLTTNAFAQSNAPIDTSDISSLIRDYPDQASIESIDGALQLVIVGDLALQIMGIEKNTLAETNPKNQILLQDGYRCEQIKYAGIKRANSITKMLFSDDLKAWFSSFNICKKAVDVSFID